MPPAKQNRGKKLQNNVVYDFAIKNSFNEKNIFTPKTLKNNNELVDTLKTAEIDFIIEENGILYPVEIKQSGNATADATSAFQILDKIPEKKRGTGAVICMCPQPGLLRENVFFIPAWYI